MQLADTYKGKKVFLTGHTGFKGSWLLLWLHSLGAEIRGYALAPGDEHKLYGHINGGGFCDSIFNDIMNYGELERSILEFEPDFVFHLAAQPIVRTSYELPVETFSVNALGTAHILNCIRRLEKPCQIVLITTDKVYNNREWPYAYRETDTLGGYDPYSASKACAELIIDSFRNSYFNPGQYHRHRKSVAVARAGNVIGGGDWAKDRIIPDIVRSLRDDRSIPVRNPQSVRPWQHVLEPLYAYLLLGSKLSQDPVKYATAYNFGPLTADCWRVEKMVQYAIDEWGKGTYHILQEENKPHEAGLLKLEVSKAGHELEWHPVFSAGEAIRTTINWYKRFDGKNARLLIGDDIVFFSKKLGPLG